MNQKQKDALINNIASAIDVMIQDSLELAVARDRTRDQDVLIELEDRVKAGRELLRRSLDQLLG
jgi:hypothetical protein